MRPNATSASAPERLPGLDALRGVAVAAVVAYHLRLELPGGFLGVDVFFALSGFLVTGLLLTELDRTGRIGLREFWGRRGRRLLPAVLAMGAGVLAAALVTGWPRTALDDTAWDGIATLTWWSNWRQALGDGGGYWSTTPSLFRHAWSLSLEEQFYVVWPVVVIASLRIARRRAWEPKVVIGVVAATLAAASTTWSLHLAHRLPDAELSRVYLGSDTRALAPLAGCALACWMHGRTLGPTGRRIAGGLGIAGAVALATIALTVHVDDPALYRRGLLPAVAVAACGMLVASTLIRRTDPVSRHLGLRSYAIYLWSWPIQVLVEHRFPTASTAPVAMVVVALTLMVAEASHRAIERPLLGRTGWAARPVARRPAWALGAGLPLGVALLAASLATEPPPHERIDPERAIELASHRPPPVTGASRSPTDDGEARPLRVMVAGDSVAFTTTFQTRRAAELTAAGIDSLDGRGVIGCGLLASEGYEWPRSDGSGWTATAGGVCADQTRVEEVGLSGSPDVLVLMPGAWETGAIRSPAGKVIAGRSRRMADVLVDDLVHQARRAAAVGARTAIVEWACPGPEAAAVHRDVGYIRWINDVIGRAAREARAGGLDVTVVEPTTEVCIDADPAGQATAAKNHALGDEVHVADLAGRLWLWTRWIGPALTGTVTDR